MPATVLICDDHAIVRAGLQLIIDSHPAFRVVGAASRAEDLIVQAAGCCPRSSSPTSPCRAWAAGPLSRRCARSRPQTRVLALTIHEDEAYFFQALDAGAEGYVLKGAPAEELLAALRLLEHGGVPVPRQLGQHLLTDYLARMKSEGAPRREQLSAREREVLRLVADGQTNKEIAQRLALGVRTVERVRAAIMESAGLHNRAELLRYARRHGLLGGSGDVALA